MRGFCASMILWSAGLAATSPATAAEVSGEFSVGDQRLEPVHATAIRIRDQFAPRSFSTYVVLSQNPVDGAAAIAQTDPYSAIINDVGLREGGAIRLSVGDGGAISSNAQFDWSGTQYVNSTKIGDLVGEFTTNAPERIAGRVRYKAPVEIDGVATDLDVRFDVPVLSAPRGAPLPKGGGDAGKAFLAFAGAVEKGDFASAQKLLSAAKAPDFAQEEWETAEENASSGLDILRAWLLKKPKVTGGESFDDRVVLEVEGEMFEGMNALSIVRMVREDGAWRYDGGATIGMLRD
jgi:hypothetical protein